jgi:4-hydroxybenzoate polyprenyltransferase
VWQTLHALWYTATMPTTSNRAADIADALPNHWFMRLLPSPLIPYAQLARLDRPIGWWLLLLPCWWSLVLAQVARGGGVPDLWAAALLLIGAIVMRGAGCVVNDLADRNFDAQVERTKNRPLPSGRVSVKQAFVFLAALLLIGLGVVLQFNTFTILLALASLIIVAIYPFMKRITYWPQLVLGLAFNWGALVGWSSQMGEISAAPLWLYAGGVFWTLAYDTIYAHQDKDDDILIGVKSTALKFGANTRPWLVGFFAATLLCLAVSLYVIGAGPLAFAGVIAAAIHAGWQVKEFDATNSAKCLELFRSNRIFGLLLLAGLLADTLVR